MKILYFGNPELANDNLAVKVGEELAKIGYDASHCTNPDDITQYDDVIILDVVKGLTKVREITIEELDPSMNISLHDFDLGFYLKLAKNLNKDFAVRIIGIPQKNNADTSIKETQEILSLRGG